jgi:hypothetical protein
MRGLLISVAALASAGAAAHTPASAPSSVCGVVQPVGHVAGLREEVVIGGGPAMLMEVAGERGAKISIARSTADSEGWRGQKTPWLVRKSYRGPIMVTASSLEHAREVRFAHVYGQHLTTLSFARDDRNRPVNGYYELPSDTLFRSTGCYAFRVTGRGFTEHLVVRVVD